VDSKARRAALRNFLKECRARLSPDDVGVVSSGRRRVPGLRREEVAELAGISLAWYTRLETARDIRVSPRLVDRLATVLRLNDDDKLELFSLTIDELPTLPRATPDSVGAVGQEYFELARFARRSRSASSTLELADLTNDLVFDLKGPAEDAYFISANFETSEFHFLAQRTPDRFEPPRRRQARPAPTGRAGFSWSPRSVILLEASAAVTRRGVRSCGVIDVTRDARRDRRRLRSVACSVFRASHRSLLRTVTSRMLLWTQLESRG
jgi:transcriptional regulator with XRE-family HTH domain